MTETDGYKIKDAELFEVSVVSVPCNQGATFGLSKSFDNMEDYNKFKQSFYQANSKDSADAVEIEQPNRAKPKKWRLICQMKSKLLKANLSSILTHSHRSC